MSDIRIHHEVRSDPRDDGWQLCFQWVTYIFDEGAPENGYRFIWRRPNGSLQPARGQARIPSAADLFDLIQRATQAGWFVSAEATPPLQAELALGMPSTPDPAAAGA